MHLPEKQYYAFEVVGISLAFQILGQILQTTPDNQQTCSCDLENCELTLICSA